MKVLRRYERVMREHPEIEAWLRNRPVNTQKGFATNLMNFCEAVGVEPEQWRRMDKFKARDLAWSYVEPLIKDRLSVAKQTMVALKSWFRNLNGELLPLDSGRGGKHNIRYVQKKAAYEHVPSKEEVYRIVDMASSLRDKAMLLILFQAGLRVNALCSLKYGDVADQLGKDTIILKITRDIDEKLRGSSIPFYFTFINGEGAVTLRQYCQLKHEQSDFDRPLFYTRNKKAVVDRWVWRIVKRCVKEAGFDPKTMWTHSFRKAFRKIVRQTNIDDDDKEQLMGHVIKGSRQAYYDRKDVDLIKKAYQKCNFAREVPEGEVTKLRKQLEDEQSKRMFNEMRLEKLESELEATRRLLKEMLEKKI
jgi:integrase